MKLTVSREARLKVASHAWNVVPLECFGILLGTTDPLRLFAALPVSHTAHWKEFGDRWTGVQEAIPMAKALAAEVKMEVIGFYASTEDYFDSAYPFPPWLATVPAGLFVLYFARCCKSCSTPVYYCGGQCLRQGDDYQECQGKRLDKTINQRRILARWTTLIGRVDYSNHEETEYPRVYGKPLPVKSPKRSKRSREDSGLIRLVWDDVASDAPQTHTSDVRTGFYSPFWANMEGQWYSCPEIESLWTAKYDRLLEELIDRHAPFLLPFAKDIIVQLDRDNGTHFAETLDIPEYFVLTRAYKLPHTRAKWIAAVEREKTKTYTCPLCHVQQSTMGLPPALIRKYGINPPWCRKCGYVQQNAKSTISGELQGG